MRRFAHIGFGSGLRRGWYRLALLSFLIFELFGLLWLLSRAAPDLRGPALAGGPLLLLAWSVIAARRQALREPLARVLALGVMLAFVGAIAGWWTWWSLGAAVWFFGVPRTLESLLGDVPAIEPPVIGNQTAPTR